MDNDQSFLQKELGAKGAPLGIEDIKALYRDYLKQAAKLESERKLGDGLFGMGKKPSDDPCHDSFASKLEAALGELAKQGSSSKDIREVLSFIYRMPTEHREPLSAYWMLGAVHGLTFELIKQLDAEDASQLRKEYAGYFKRWERLPVQQQVYSALGRK